MQDSVSKRSPNHRWYWLTALLAVVVAGALWLGALWGTGNKAAPVQPVAKSTEWTAEPTGPAVPVNLPKTPMTNTPDKAP
jgi:hypothetical protein